MSAFVRAARFVGDLDDEFYADELQRDIWNEASAVGLQSLLWIGLIAGAILPYMAGVTGAWVALGIFLAIFASAYVVIGYARARGVDAHTIQEWRRPRAAVFLVLYLMGAGGTLVRLVATYLGGSTLMWVSMAVAAVVGAAAAAVGVNTKKRKQREAELAAEKAELQGFDETD
jgi:positive regulator of sigma E activity